MPTCMTCLLNKCILKILKIQFKVEAIFLYFEYYNHCEQLRAPFILYIFFYSQLVFCCFLFFFRLPKLLSKSSFSASLVCHPVPSACLHLVPKVANGKTLCKS